MVHRRNYRVGLAFVVLAAAAGVWVYARLQPPPVAINIVHLLNTPEERASELLARASRWQTLEEVESTRDHLVRVMAEFAARGTPPWTLVSWEPAVKGEQSFLVRDAASNETRIRAAARDDGSVAALWYWPYVRGHTLSEIADSALAVTGKDGLTLAYSLGGKTLVEARGTRAPASDAKLQADDRWPVELNLMFLYLAVARLVESGALNWDDRVQALLPQYRLPEWAQPMTLKHLVQGSFGKGFADPRSYPVREEPPRNQAELDGFLKRIFASSALEAGSNSGNELVLLEVLQSASGKFADQVFGAEVIQPLELTETGYGAAEVGSLADYGELRTLSSIADGQGLSSSVPDLLRLGLLKLEEERDASKFLRAESFSALRRAPPAHQPNFVSGWEWYQFKGSKGNFWRINIGGCVELGVFPEQDAVVAVAMDGLVMETIDQAGPIFWRIAEELCGWPKKPLR